jgi:hypothetical protein
MKNRTGLLLALLSVAFVLTNNSAIALVYQGLTNTSLGSATLSVVSNQLTVGNLGTNGQDGVNIALPGGTLWEAHWLDLDPSNALPVGAHVQSQIIGTAGAVTNGLLASWQLTKTGDSNYVVTADYSAIGATTETLRVYNGTNLVATTNGQSGALCVVTGGNGCVNDDHHGNPVPVGPDGLPGLGGVGLTLFGPATFTFQDASTALGDRLVILPEGGSSVSSLSGTRLLASDIPSITITNEQAILALTARQHIHNHVMLEAMANGYYQIQQEFGLDPKSTITWTATYSETGWTGSITGRLYNQSLTLNYTGTTVYDVGQNASNTFSASGAYGTNGITINGTAALGYNVATGGYTNMNFQDQGDVETPRLKWYVVAAEVIVGGAVGGVLDDGAGVLAGASLGVDISDKLSANTTDGSSALYPGTPPAPAPPATVNAALSFVPGTNELVIRVFGTGVENANVGNQIVLSGNWANGQASGVGSMASLVYQGLTNTHLGFATLSAVSNQLTVGNLGTNGQDGVSIALNGAHSFEAGFLDLDPSNALPVGASVQSQIIGTAGSVTNGLLGSTLITKAGTSNWVMSVDYSPLGSSTRTVQVWNGSNLVAQVAGQTGSVCATSILWPGPWKCTANWWLNMEWPIPILMTISGGPTVMGTEILMIPEGAAAVSSVSAVQILAAYIPSITITNESVSFGPLLKITSIARSGNNIVLAWTTEGITNIVQVTTNTTGNYNTNNFVNLANLVITTITTNYVDVGGATNKPARYYRIREPQ